MATAVPASTNIVPGQLSGALAVRAVVDYVQGGDDAELREIARRELNFVIDEINTYNWRRLIGSQLITLVADEDEYSVDFACKEPYRAILYLGDERKLRLLYEDWVTFQERFDDRSIGHYPGCYTFDHENRVVVLEGTPTADSISTYDTLKLHYHKRLTYYANDSDAHGGPPEFNAYLIWRARAGLAAVRGDASSSFRADGKADRLFRDLRVNDSAAATDWE